jgi:O-antigen/teichoic acid export membrane protein
MNFKPILSNFAAAFSSQFVAVVVSIFTSLLVPKLLGVTEYGYYQLFVFYCTYSSLFSLGINEGVYLIQGGTPRSKINKRQVNSQFWFGMAYQTVFALIIAIITVLNSTDSDREFVIILTAICILIQNASYFYGYTLQAMNETKTYSISVIIDRIFQGIPVVILLLLHVTSFEPYVYTYLFSKTCQLAYILFHTRDFLSSGTYKFAETIGLSLKSMRAGIKLTIASIASSLIVGAARFVIDYFWGIEAFGQLSLSISCVNFFLAFSAQVAMVLFPALRQTEESEISKFYVASRNCLELFFPAMYLLYFPFVLLLGLWLPQYVDALVYFAYMIPICLFDSQMQIVYQTLFKVRREETLLMRINIAFAAIGFGACVVVAICFNSIHAVIISTVATIAGRAIYSEHRLNMELETGGNPLVLGEIIMTIVFVALTVTLPASAAAATYAVLCVLYAAVFRKDMRQTVISLRNVLR